MASNVFPEDLGDSQTGHSVGFTAYNSSAAAQSIANIGQIGAGAFDILGQSLFGFDPEIVNNTMNFIGMGDAPNTYYTTPIDSVFMYVPAGGQSPMTWDSEHVYTDVKLARAVTNWIGVTEMAETIAGMTGRAINPRVQVLFQTTNLRQFDFTFLMAPQSKTESDSMKSIIKCFRKNSAPTLGTGGYLFRSPPEWQIHFWYKEQGAWKENDNIPKIKRSVLNRVNVSYPVPGGEYSTFSNGHPVSAMIQLKFTEMSIVDSKRIDEGY